MGRRKSFADSFDEGFDLGYQSVIRSRSERRRDTAYLLDKSIDQGDNTGITTRRNEIARDHGLSDIHKNYIAKELMITPKIDPLQELLYSERNKIAPAMPTISDQALVTGDGMRGNQGASDQRTLQNIEAQIKGVESSADESVMITQKDPDRILQKFKKTKGKPVDATYDAMPVDELGKLKNLRDVVKDRMEGNRVGGKEVDAMLAEEVSNEKFDKERRGLSFQNELRKRKLAGVPLTSTEKYIANLDGEKALKYFRSDSFQNVVIEKMKHDMEINDIKRENKIFDQNRKVHELNNDPRREGSMQDQRNALHSAFEHLMQKYSKNPKKQREVFNQYRNGLNNMRAYYDRPEKGYTPEYFGYSLASGVPRPRRGEKVYDVEVTGRDGKTRFHPIAMRPDQLKDVNKIVDETAKRMGEEFHYATKGKIQIHRGASDERVRFKTDIEKETVDRLRGDKAKKEGDKVIEEETKWYKLLLGGKGTLQQGINKGVKESTSKQPEYTWIYKKGVGIVRGAPRETIRVGNKNLPYNKKGGKYYITFGRTKTGKDVVRPFSDKQFAKYAFREDFTNAMISSGLRSK